MIKQLSKSIAYAARDLLYLADFSVHALYHREFTNKIKRDQRGKLALLANGPSLKEVLPKLETEQFADTDFIVLNFFAECDEFWKVKPKHYCMADPMFFRPTHRLEKVKALFILLEKVDWPLNIYVPNNLRKKFIQFSGIKNPNITIIPVNTTDCSRCGSGIRNFLYKRGLSMPIIGTVAILAIYVGIMSRYTRIDLYGVDHTFFDSMCVDDNNRLCNQDTHFYDDGEPKLTPIIRNDNSRVWKIADYLKAIRQMFVSHDLLQNFAEYMGVEIINCTACSMIDSYKRLSQLK